MRQQGSSGFTVNRHVKDSAYSEDPFPLLLHIIDVIQMKVLTHMASVADVEEIVSLWRRFMTEEAEVVPDANPEKAEQTWAERLQSQIADSKVIVADDGGTLIGFFAFIDHDDREWVPDGIAYVVDIYIVPEARASTAARALFRAASELLRTAYSETWTNTHANNKRVQVLLKRAGFRSLDGFEIWGLKDQVYYRLDNDAMQSDCSHLAPLKANVMFPIVDD